MRHIRMRHQLRPQIAAVPQHLHHAGGDNLRRQSAQHQRGERRGRRGLGDHRIARQQRRGQLQDQHQQRIVPGHDRHHQPKRKALFHHQFPGGLLQHARFQPQPGVIAQRGDGALHLAARFIQQLALFAGQHAGEGLGMGLQGIGQSLQHSGALVHGHQSPITRGTLARRHRLLGLQRIGARGLGENLPAGRFDHRKKPRARNQAPVDQKMVMHGHALPCRAHQGERSA
jgi:hypothetical protein